jgi:hypothetical protein
MLPTKLGLIWPGSFRGEDLLQIWLPRAILVSDWLMLNKSPLKLLGQIKLNLAGSIYARSSIKHPERNEETL